MMSADEDRTRAALDGIAAAIVEQANLEGILFSDLERTMLYFSETEWAPLSEFPVSE